MAQALPFWRAERLLRRSERLVVIDSSAAFLDSSARTLIMFLKQRHNPAQKAETLLPGQIDKSIPDNNRGCSPG
jgi:hypothetical protein